MLDKPVGRLNFVSALAAIALVAFPLLCAFADPPDSAPADNEKAAILKGKVTDDSGNPLANARVSVAVPAMDMRHVDVADDEHRILHVKTDADGEYVLEVPDIAGPTKVSVDAALPGYQRSWGMMMLLGNHLSKVVEPEKTVKADMRLKSADYYSGRVVDQRGAPLAGIRIFAKAKTRGFGGVEMTVSDGDGQFQLFNYPLDLGAARGLVSFTHPDYIDNSIEDVYKIAKPNKKSILVVMDAGRKVSGNVFNTQGKPVEGVMVKCEGIVPNAVRKAVLTDSKGAFSLKGLSAGHVKISCVDRDNDQKYQESLFLEADRTDMELKLQPIDLPDMVVHKVMGMELVDYTEELSEAYSRYWSKGAFIVSPGDNYERFGIGKLEKADYFWMVGEKRVANTTEMIEQLVAEADKQGGEVQSIRVVYGHDRPSGEGTNTQYLRMTKDDLESLRGLLKR